DHADYIKRMDMLFTINLRPHNSTNVNTNDESFSSFQILNQESEPRQEEIDVIFETNDVLPLSDDDLDDEVNDGDSQREEIDIVISIDDVLPLGVENDDSDGEIDAVDDLRVDNSISNSEHEFFKSEDSDFDNPSIPRPPPEPPDAEFDAGGEIVVSTKDEDVDYSSFIFVIYPE
nr:hypothetical protein [Tanacetum cinerariifolium]